MNTNTNAPARASIKSVNNYLAAIGLETRIFKDAANGWKISLYRELEDGGSYDIGKTLYETPRQFLDAFEAGE